MRAVRKYKNGGTEPTRFEKAFAKALEAGDKTFMFDKDGDGVMEEFTTDIRTQTPGGRIGEEQVFTGTPEQFAIIQEGQGAYPVGTAEVGVDFVPRNKEEQDAYDNLGVEGAFAVRKLMANVAGDRSKFAEDYVLPFLMNTIVPGSMGAGPLAYGASSRTPSILSRSYNVNPNNPRSLYGIQPMNIYERAATDFGRRFGTRTTAGRGPFTKGPFGYGGKQGMGRVSEVLDDLVERYLSSPR